MEEIKLLKHKNWPKEDKDRKLYMSKTNICKLLGISNNKLNRILDELELDPDYYINNTGCYNISSIYHISKIDKIKSLL